MPEQEVLDIDVAYLVAKVDNGARIEHGAHGWAVAGTTHFIDSGIVTEALRRGALRQMGGHGTRNWPTAAPYLAMPVSGTRGAREARRLLAMLNA